MFGVAYLDFGLVFVLLWFGVWGLLTYGLVLLWFGFFSLLVCLGFIFAYCCVCFVLFAFGVRLFWLEIICRLFLLWFYSFICGCCYYFGPFCLVYWLWFSFGLFDLGVYLIGLDWLRWFVCFDSFWFGLGSEGLFCLVLNCLRMLGCLVVWF